MRGRLLKWAWWLALGTWITWVVALLVEVAISEPFHPDGTPLTLMEELSEVLLFAAFTAIFALAGWLVDRTSPGRLQLGTAVAVGLAAAFLLAGFGAIWFLPVVLLWVGALISGGSSRTHPTDA